MVSRRDPEYRETHPREEQQQQPQKSSDEKLLNGPHRLTMGKQADIDALLAS
jgi:hypothetical protein